MKRFLIIAALALPLMSCGGPGKSTVIDVQAGVASACKFLVDYEFARDVLANLDPSNVAKGVNGAIKLICDGYQNRSRALSLKDDGKKCPWGEVNGECIVGQPIEPKDKAHTDRAPQSEEWFDPDEADRLTPQTNIPGLEPAPKN
jgi:hypothetical protein